MDNRFLKSCQECDPNFACRAHRFIHPIRYLTHMPVINEVAEVVDQDGHMVSCFNGGPCRTSCAFFLDHNEEMISSIARNGGSMQTTNCGLKGALMSLAYEPQRSMRLEWNRLLRGPK